MNRNLSGWATVLLTGVAVAFGSAYIPNVPKTLARTPMQAGAIAEEGTMPDFGPGGNGNGFGCSSNAGIPVIRLSNGGVTVYFEKTNGRLLQITNASGQPFTFGGRGVCDNTGLFQDWEPKNSNWSGCSTPPGRVSPPIDFCSITAYLAGELNPAVQPNPSYEITSQGEPHLHVSNVSQFEGPAPGVWGNVNYDPQPGSKWTFDIDYFVKPSGVINVQFKVSNSNPSECFSPWISFPFVLVSPYGKSDSYVFETGPPGSRRIQHDDFFSSAGVKDTYIFNDPTITGLNANVQDNRYSPLLHKAIDVPASAMCPAGRNKESHGPYSTLTGLYPDEFTSLGPYFGIHKSDMSSGVIAKVPLNTSQIVLYQPGEPDGVAEAFVATKLPIGRTDLGEHYFGSIYFMPWGGANGVDLPTAKLLLNDYVSPITSPASGQCACSTDESGTSDPLQNFALEVGPNSTASISTLSTAAAPNTGYITAEQNGGAASSYGTAVFTVRQNGVVVSEAGVPATAPTKAARLFVEIGSAESRVNTGIALVNPAKSAARLTLTLRNEEGQAIASGTTTLAPGEHISRFIHELPLIAPGFVLPPNVAQTGAKGAFDISSTVPVSVMALRLTVNQRGETLLTTTPTVDMTRPPLSVPLALPQFAVGGGYTNTIVLLNDDVQGQSGELVFWNDDGSPATMPMDGYSPSHSFTYVIPVGGIRIFRSSSQGTNVRVGWAEAVPDPLRTAPAGAGVFQLAGNGVIISETGVPASPSLRQLAAIVDLSAGHNIGLALANPGGVDLPMQLTVTKNGGPEFASANITLPPHGHTSRFVTEIFPGMPPGFVGELRLSVSGPAGSGVTGLTLRSLINERREFLMTTFPVVDPMQAAPSPLIFPQIADGGGYTTQLILMNLSSSTISSAVRFFSDQGRWFSIQP